MVDKRLPQQKSSLTTLINAGGEHDKEARYLLARGTMLLWPVDLTAEAGNAVGKFLEIVLEIPTTTVKSLNIESIDKLEQGRRSKIRNEIRVVFSTSRERDLVQSFAANLAKVQGQVGISMELPEHLKGLFKLFEVHEANLRQRFPGLKRSIKYDDSTQSLCMDVKLAEKAKWHRVGEAEMREIARQQNGRTVPVAATLDDEEDRRLILSTGLEDPEEETAVPVASGEESENE